MPRPIEQIAMAPILSNYKLIICLKGISTAAALHQL